MIFLVNIVEALNDALRTFLGWLCKIIYPMIINVWDLFVALSDARLFNSSGAGFISEIYKRVGLLLGLIMLFRVLFSLIQMLLNPDMFSDKEKGIGNIVKKAIVVILLLGFTPTIFEGAFYIQSKVLDENILGKIVFGNANVENLDDFGKSLSTSLFGSFFVLNPLDEEEAAKYCKNYDSILEELAYYERLDTIDSCLTSKFDFSHYFSSSNGTTEETSRVYAIEFNLNGILAVFVGGMVLWLMLMYCIYLGARIVQLAFLQIIAPLSIVSYLSPKKDTGLEKWLKLCLSTFLDVFIRISIIYFISLVIYLLFKSKNGEGFLLLEQTSGASGTLLLFVRIAVILGLLMVGKKLPDLIGEIFPSLGVGKSALGFGISWKKMTESMLGGGFLYGATAGTAKFAGRVATAGVVGAALGGAIGFFGRKDGRLGGVLGGMGRGMVTGAKKGGFKNMGKVVSAQAKANKSYADWRAEGGTDSFSRFTSGIAKKFGRPTSYEKTKEHVDVKKREKDSYSTKANAAKGFSSIFDAAASTAKDSNRASTTFTALGSGGAAYLEGKGVKAKLEAAGIRVDSSQKFSDILERSKAKKERSEMAISNIDSEIRNINTLKDNALNSVIDPQTGVSVTKESIEAKIRKLSGEKIMATSNDQVADIEAEIKRLEAQKDVVEKNEQMANMYDAQLRELYNQRQQAVTASENINIGEIEKAIGEARLSEFLTGNVVDKKAESELDTAMKQVNSIINAMESSGDGMDDPDVAELKEYLSAIQGIRAAVEQNGSYTFDPNRPLQVSNSSYTDAFKLYDDMIIKARNISNSNEAVVKAIEEEIRQIESTPEFRAAQADDKHGGGSN